jgi:MoxR-like ATPase
MTDVSAGIDGWQIYRGMGERHDGIAELTGPPPWRQFDGEILPDDSEEAWRADPRPGAEDRARAYRPEGEVVAMANAAIYLRRPLLVTGRPGTGKSTLAHSIAWELGLGPVLYWPITSRAELKESLYRYDAIGRLHEANLRRTAPHEGAVTNPVGPFVTLGPLGTALVARKRPRVLLIDEFDKSDIDLPNDLLNVFEEGQFVIPELVREHNEEPVRLATEDGGSVMVRGGRVRCNAFPIIVVTSNGERVFPHAFKRRCVELEIKEPDRAKLAEIVRVQLGEEALAKGQELLEAYLELREAGEGHPIDQLLNAIFLAAFGPTADSERRRQAADVLLGRARAGVL